MNRLRGVDVRPAGYVLLGAGVVTLDARHVGEGIMMLIAGLILALFAR